MKYQFADIALMNVMGGIMEFKDILRQVRIEAGIKQSDLAKKMDLSSKTISTYENGTREPKIEILIKLADEFDLPLDQLVGRKKTPGHTFPEIEAANLDERKLLQMFRQISGEDQQKVLAIVKTLHDMGKGAEKKDFYSEKDSATAG